MLPELKRRGYSVVTLSDLVAERASGVVPLSTGQMTKKD
jgi:hypothetical protein